jgi:uncharacterized protein YdeI (YjbR/CyaY-like superfamily)
MDPRVDDFLEKKATGWKNEVLSKIRALILDTSPKLKETIKWGVPYYEGKKNVLGMTSFKDHVAIWFQEGVHLSDPKKLLVQAQDITKAQRQIRISENDNPDYETIALYIQEAAENDAKGTHTKPAKKPKTVELPAELDSALTDNERAKEEFENLSPYKKREYAEYIETAKREDTKQRRLEKIIPMIEKGKGLNDKYK